MSEQENLQEQSQSQEIATIGEKHYFKDSMSEELVAAFNQALQINEKIAAKELDIRDLKYARQYLIEFIESKKDTMKEFIPADSEDKESTEEATNE